jgi:hypothetical protein
MSNNFFPAVQYLHQYSPESPLSQLAQMTAIKASQQEQANEAQLQPGKVQAQTTQNQLGAQAVQSGALDLAQRAAINKAWQEAVVPDSSGTVTLDPNKLQSALATSGHGEAIPSIVKGLTDMNSSIMGLAQKKSELAAQEADAAGAGAQAVIASGKQNPDGSITYDPNVKQAFFQHMQAAGYGQEAQQLQQHLQQAPQTETQLWKQLIASSPKQQQLAAETATAASKTSEAQTAADKLAFEKTGGQNPDVRELNDFLQKNPGKGPSDFLVWKAQHSPTMIMQGGFGNQGDPMVDMVGTGRVDLQTALQRVPPAAKDRFMSQLAQKYPDYNQAQFGVQKKVQEEFTSGDAAKSLTAFNTAIDHAKQLSAATDALDNGDVRALNAIGNKLGYEFGSDKTTNFNVIKNALAGEISKVFKGGGATDAEIEQVSSPFSSANSTAQLKGAINQAQSLMASKRDALQQQYNAGKQGKPNFGSQSNTPGPGTAKFHYQGKNGEIFSDDGKNWFDGNGKKIGSQ